MWFIWWMIVFAAGIYIFMREFPYIIEEWRRLREKQKNDWPDKPKNDHKRKRSWAEQYDPEHYRITKTLNGRSQTYTVTERYQEALNKINLEFAKEQADALRSYEKYKADQIRELVDSQNALDYEETRQRLLIPPPLVKTYDGTIHFEYNGRQPETEAIREQLVNLIAQIDQDDPYKYLHRPPTIEAFKVMRRMFYEKQAQIGSAAFYTTPAFMLDLFHRDPVAQELIFQARNALPKGEFLPFYEDFVYGEYVDDWALHEKEGSLPTRVLNVPVYYHTDYILDKAYPVLLGSPGGKTLALTTLGELHWMEHFPQIHPGVLPIKPRETDPVDNLKIWALEQAYLADDYDKAFSGLLDALINDARYEIPEQPPATLKSLLALRDTMTTNEEVTPDELNYADTNQTE